MTAARKLKAPPRMSSPFTGALTTVLDGARSLYRMEVERLTSELRPRILAGEWSGHADERGGFDNGGPRYCRLAWELETTHPWCEQQQTIPERPESYLVIAASTWPQRDDRMCHAAGVSGSEYGPTAGECLAHDVLAEAARRGWIDPLRNVYADHPYRLRVAK